MIHLKDSNCFTRLEKTQCRILYLVSLSCYYMCIDNFDKLPIDYTERGSILHKIVKNYMNQAHKLYSLNQHNIATPIKVAKHMHKQSSSKLNNTSSMVFGVHGRK